MTARVRLSAPFEAWLCGLLAGLWVSGVVWLVAHHGLAPRDDMATHPAESWSLRLHGALAMAMLVALGQLLGPHMVGAWRRRRNRGSGGAMAAAMAFLVLGGYLLYYSGWPALRDAVSVTHWGAGLALPALLALHMARGGRWRRPRHGAAGRAPRQPRFTATPDPGGGASPRGRYGK